MGKRFRSPHLLDDGFTETREDGSKEEFYPDPGSGVIRGSRGTVLVPDRYGGYTRHDENGSETFVRGLLDDNLYGSKGTVDTQNLFGDSISLVPDAPPPPLFPEAQEPSPAPQPPRPTGEYRTTMQNSTRGMRFEAEKLRLNDAQRKAYLRYGASVLRQKLPPEGRITSTEFYTEELSTGFLGLKKQQVQRSRTVKGEGYWVLEHHEKTDEGGAWLETTEVTEQLLTLSGEIWEHKIVDHIHRSGRSERSYDNYAPKEKIGDYHLDELDLKFSRLGIPMTAARFFAPRETPAPSAKPADRCRRARQIRPCPEPRARSRSTEYSAKGKPCAAACRPGALFLPAGGSLSAQRPGLRRCGPGRRRQHPPRKLRHPPLCRRSQPSCRCGRGGTVSENASRPQEGRQRLSHLPGAEKGAAPKFDRCRRIGSSAAQPEGSWPLPGAFRLVVLYIIGMPPPAGCRCRRRCSRDTRPGW